MVDDGLVQTFPLLLQQNFKQEEIISGTNWSFHLTLQQAPDILHGIEIGRSSWPAQGSEARLSFERTSHKTPVTSGVIIHENPVARRLSQALRQWKNMLSQNLNIAIGIHVIPLHMEFRSSFIHIATQTSNLLPP
ncbi:MAG: hypothetical protein AAGK05_13770 [Pseudomonadota bacterium]